MFGLGFLLLVIGLSGIANIQETKYIHEQVLAAEDNYRHVEKLVEAIRSDLSRAAVLRRDRLLEPNLSSGAYAQQLQVLRSKIEGNLAELRVLRPEQGDDAGFERIAAALGGYLHTAFDQRRENSDAGVLAIAGDLSKLNDANFEMRRRTLNETVKSLQRDIWETILTALVLGTVIAGASVFRISSLEKHSARQQRATEQAEERLRQLSQQLVSSQEQERKALSRELHDEIGQLLTALRMELGNLERAERAAGDEASPHLQQAKKLTETTLRTTRDIAMGLRPAMLDILGLGPAMEWQAREFTRRYRIPVQLEIDSKIGEVPDPHRTYLYRIVQEGLTNCARHAQAKSVRVCLEDSGGQLAVRVEDDGIGFNPHGEVVYGLGLLGMAERVRELCGKIRIDSKPGQGTRISVTLPLDRKAGELQSTSGTG